VSFDLRQRYLFILVVRERWPPGALDVMGLGSDGVGRMLSFWRAGGEGGSVP